LIAFREMFASTALRAGVWLGFAFRAPVPPPAAATSPVLSIVVFYDENGNGRLDAGENVRLPGVAVDVGGATLRTERGSGRATVPGLAPGTQRAAVQSRSLPPFYAAGAGRSVTLPVAGDVSLPVTLPIGGNRPNTYLAFGDSLSEGVGSSDGSGYRSRLQALLREHFGEASVRASGVEGSDSHRGARRVKRVLAQERPAYTLVLYGTNDWNEDGVVDTVTLNSLRRIVGEVKAARSLPLLATLIPTHVGTDPRASLERNRWVERINERIATLARQEGALLVDLHRAFATAAEPARLYSDGLHPNDAGYALIAQVFFEALTRKAAP